MDEATGLIGNPHEFSDGETTMAGPSTIEFGAGLKDQQFERAAALYDRGALLAESQQHNFRRGDFLFVALISAMLAVGCLAKANGLDASAGFEDCPITKVSSSAAPIQPGPAGP